MFNTIVCGLESCFPLVPQLTPQEVTTRRWLPVREYYFTDDTSPRYGQRLRALLSFNRKNVSFWRRREVYRQERLAQS